MQLTVSQMKVPSAVPNIIPVVHNNVCTCLLTLMLTKLSFTLLSLPCLAGGPYWSRNSGWELTPLVVNDNSTVQEHCAWDGVGCCTGNYYIWATNATWAQVAVQTGANTMRCSTPGAIKLLCLSGNNVTGRLDKMPVSMQQNVIPTLGVLDLQSMLLHSLCAAAASYAHPLPCK